MSNAVAMTQSPPPIFDRALQRQRQKRALWTGAADFMLQWAADEICERLAVVKRRFTHIADIGTPTPMLAQRLLAQNPDALIARQSPTLAGIGQAPLLRLVGDEEALPFRNASFDLTVSALSLHLANDLPGALIQARRALKPDGLFLGALLGGSSLQELREALAIAETEIAGGVSPRVAPFADIRDMGALLQRAGFALPVTDSETVTVRYDTLFALMKDLRAMGAANALHERAHSPPSRRLFLRAAEIYAERFADSHGRVRATFEIIFLSGWAPHESQQKPLPPGSAQMRLADALTPKHQDPT